MEIYRHVKVRTDTAVRLVFYPGEGHGNRRVAAQYHYGISMTRWMTHYVKGDGGEPPPHEIDHATRLKEAAKARANGE